MLGLTKHSYAAEIAGGLVFLNLKGDTYTYLAPEDAAVILPMLRGDLGEFEAPAGVGDSIVDELVNAGLVTADPTGRPLRPIRYDQVLDEQPRLIGPDRPRVRPTHVWNFLRSVFEARAMLSLLPLHRVVALVKTRRSRISRAVPAHSAEQLTEIYRRLRPLLFSRNDKCLLDSLSLIHFLARYRVPAQWRFGVRLEPFKAHAWVQDDRTVFDDMAANVHAYTVILEA